MKIFDTHSHYNDEVYNNDIDNVLVSLKKDGVLELVNISAEIVDFDNLYNLTKKYKGNDSVPKMHYTIGFHPDNVPLYKSDSTDGNKLLDTMSSFVNKDIKPIAIGEIGLDYYREGKDEEIKKCQKDWFIAEINLARELNLPIVIHSREACKDTMDILKEYAKDLKVVVHCFSYEKEIAKEYIKMGYYIGVGGVLTFKNERKLKEVVSEIPIDKILTETDCPYLSPTPHRGERNLSSYIKYVINAISNIKNIDEENLSEELYNNALRFYNLL